MTILPFLSTSAVPDRQSVWRYFSDDGNNFSLLMYFSIQNVKKYTVKRSEMDNYPNFTYDKTINATGSIDIIIY